MLAPLHTCRPIPHSISSNRRECEKKCGEPQPPTQSRKVQKLDGARRPHKSSRSHGSPSSRTGSSLLRSAHRLEPPSERAQSIHPRRAIAPNRATDRGANFLRIVCRPVFVRALFAAVFTRALAVFLRAALLLAVLLLTALRTTRVRPITSSRPSTSAGSSASSASSSSRRLIRRTPRAMTAIPPMIIHEP